MTLETQLNLQTTAAQRARIRELAERPSMDDYDRSVLMLLDDFARCITMLGILAGGESRRAEPKN